MKPNINQLCDNRNEFCIVSLQTFYIMDVFIPDSVNQAYNIFFVNHCNNFFIIDGCV